MVDYLSMVASTWVARCLCDKLVTGRVNYLRMVDYSRLKICNTDCRDTNCMFQAFFIFYVVCQHNVMLDYDA